MKPLAKQNPHGFTLLELLVAVAIFAVLSAMAYGGLRNVIDNSQQTEIAMLRLQQVQLAMLKVSRDLTQLSQRSIRDEYGNSSNYILTGQGDDIFIEFTRGGRRNPAEMLRSHLQRVAYKIEENTLSRLHWPQLDRTQEMLPYESVLLEEVDGASYDDLANATRQGVVENNTIKTHIVHLRKKFRQVDADFDCIRTKYGYGYHWICR